MFAQASGIGDGRWSPDVSLLQMLQLLLKFRVSHRFPVGNRQFVQRRDERLRHEAPAEFTEVAALIGDVGGVGFNVSRINVMFVHYYYSSLHYAYLEG